jgi:hypothetical protein
MLSQSERGNLKWFCELSDTIAACRFIREFLNQPHHIFVGNLPDGTVKDEWPRYDDDDFLAFMTHYRKLRLNNEPTNLFRIANLVAREGDDEARELVQKIKSEVNAEGGGWWGATLKADTDEPIFLNQFAVEDLTLNANVFHTDPEKKQVLDQIVGEGGLMKALAFWNYPRFARTVVFWAGKLADLIRTKGYLSASNTNWEMADSKSSDI